MKYQLFALMMWPFLLISQSQEGAITYVETMQLDMEIPEEHQAELAGLFPESTSTTKVLLFNSEASIYKNAEEPEDQVVEAGSEESGMHIKMVMAMPDLQVYKDIKGQKMIEKDEIMGRPFLIEAEIGNFPWKLHNEEKEILGFTCRKAILDDDEHEVVAWYALDIPVSNGPMEFGQLPGMILALDLNNGEITINASEVDLRKLNKGEIEEPKKGKRVTREKFQKLQEEKEREMQEAYGGSGGNVIIRERRD